MSDVVAAISRGLSRIALVAAGLGLIAMTGILFWQVFARYALQASPAWSEQAALALLIGVISLAAAASVREGYHIGMTIVVDALPPLPARIARVLAMGVTAGFGIALGVYGGDLVAQTWSHALPSLPLSRGAVYAPLAAAGWLMAFFAAEQAIAAARGRTIAPLWN